MKKQKKKSKKGAVVSRFIGSFLILLQGVASAIFVALVVSMGVLPEKYILALAGMLLVLFGITLWIHRVKKGRTVIAKLLSLILVLSISVASFYSWKINAAISEMTTDEDSSEDSTDVYTQPFSVYVSGIDTYGDVDTTGRSDVNIIAYVNPTTHEILLVNTPRDYYVPIPGVSGGENDKLTHAGIYGVDASIATLNQLYDTDIDFYVRINFTSLIDIVDEMGGIDVYSEYAFTTSSNSGYVMDVVEGENHFDGKEALAFARERKNLAAGDNQRGKDQEAVITAMIEKMTTPAMVLKASSIIDSVSSNVQTDMSDKQIQSLIKKQLADGTDWEVTSVAAEGTAGTDYCYSMSDTELYVTYPDEDSVSSIKSLITALLNGEDVATLAAQEDEE